MYNAKPCFAFGKQDAEEAFIHCLVTTNGVPDKRIF
jgi:hypothetical protein